jgi:hypothetical protein
MQDPLESRAADAAPLEIPLEGSPVRVDEAQPPEPGFFARLVRRLLSLLPWVSLVLSTFSAVMMERNQAQARLVAAIAAGSWVAMLLVSFVLGYVEQKVQAAWVKGVARFSMTALAQNVLQLCLYFALPLYLFSAAFTFPQIVFLAAMLAAAVIVTWDPYCERALESAFMRPLLTAFISFSAMAAVLPMIGLPHGPSLWIAAMMVAVFAPLVRYVELRRERIPVQTILISALVPIALFFDLARAVPPAPLRLVEIGLGTGVVSRTLQGESDYFETPPAKMHCFSAIAAPAGLRENLEHVWMHDGKVFDPIVLEVRGGREEGFRTWTRRSLGKNPSGKWTCEVRTPQGQVLGRTSATVK